MNCTKCNSERIASVSAKCDDRCFITVGNQERSDYPPRDMGIGGGDYVDFSYCLDCGQMQGQFPLAPTEMEEHDDV